MGSIRMFLHLDCFWVFSHRFTYSYALYEWNVAQYCLLSDWFDPVIMYDIHRFFYILFKVR